MSMHEPHLVNHNFCCSTGLRPGMDCHCLPEYLWRI